MPPALSDYQTAANAIYEPQKQADSIQLAATRDTTKNALESQKGQVNTDYTSAIDQLTHSVQDQTNQINQLYSQRLGGNFSGLQGNDLGNMFSRANEQQGLIESTRANKLSEITAGETNADIDYGAGVASLTPKYQSLETQYAQDAYGSAVKEYNTEKQQAQTQANSDRSFNLEVAKFNQSATNSTNSQATQKASQYKAVKDVSGNGGFTLTGPGGQPVNLAEYASGAGKDVNDILDFLRNGSGYDRAIYNQVKANGLATSPQDIINTIAAEDKQNRYGFR